MRYPASETAEKHERILDEAARLFRERGFSGAGVAEIMKAAGLTHGAFYTHFDSKEALTREALVRAFEQSERNLSAISDGAADQKQAFLDRYLSRAHRDRTGQGCALAALGPEVARDEAVRVPLTRHVRQVIERMTASFSWKRRGAERQQAIHLLAAAVGALILARAVEDPAFSDEILDSVRESLSAL